MGKTINQKPKWDESGLRLCGNIECDQHATHALCWTEGWVYYCQRDAQWMVTVGNNMSFYTAARTYREMTPAEKHLGLLAILVGNQVSKILSATFNDTFTYAGFSVSADNIQIDFTSETYQMSLPLIVTDEITLMNSRDFYSRLVSMVSEYLMRVFAAHGEDLQHAHQTQIVRLMDQS